MTGIFLLFSPLPKHSLSIQPTQLLCCYPSSFPPTQSLSIRKSGVRSLQRHCSCPGSFIFSTTYHLPSWPDTETPLQPGGAQAAAEQQSRDTSSPQHPCCILGKNDSTYTSWPTPAVLCSSLVPSAPLFWSLTQCTSHHKVRLSLLLKILCGFELVRFDKGD